MMSLFANMAYEGSRAIIGPYLASVGATGAIIGFVAGASEFLAHALRMLSNYFSTKKEQYWKYLFLGYSLNLLVLPALAFAQHWFSIAALVLLERLGRAVRSRPRDNLLNLAGEKSGLGVSWAIGIHAVFNQMGRVAGPLAVAVVLYMDQTYQKSFLFLIIPILLSLITLLLAHKLWHNSGAVLENTNATEQVPVAYPQAYKYFLIGTSLIGFAYADFALISFHLLNTLPLFFIPILYALAMSIEGFFGIGLSIFSETNKIKILVFATCLSAFAAPLLFYGELFAILAGVALWGVGLSAQNILMKPCVAALNEKRSRRFAYGLFDSSFAFSWFAGSIAMGFLYDSSIKDLVILSVACQALAIPFLCRACKLSRAPAPVIVKNSPSL